MGDECLCKNRDRWLVARGEMSIHSEPPQEF